MIRKFLFLVVGVGLLVSGCNSESKVNNATEEVSAKEVEEVTSQQSNDNYYEQVRKFNNEFVKFLEDTYPVVLNGTLTDSTKEELVNTTNKFILYLDDFNPTPVTESDEKYNEYLNDMIYDLEKYADYTLQYAFKEENVYKSFVKDHFKNIQIHLSTLTEMEKLYY